MSMIKLHMYLNIFLIINGMYLHIIIWTKKNIFFRNNEDSNEQKRVSINVHKKT